LCAFGLSNTKKSNGPLFMNHQTFCRLGKLMPLLLMAMMASAIVYSQPRSGNGYENLSRRTTGGKIRKGDTLDIKMAIHIPWGFNGGGSGRIFAVRFLDNIPSNTLMLSGSSDSIRILTNEDSTYMRFTTATSDDAASFLASPGAGQFNVKLNLGPAASAPASNSLSDVTGAGQINLTSNWPYGDRPKWWTGHIFSTSYRVRVTGNVGDTIQLFGGRLVYRLTAGGSDVTLSGVPYKMIIGADDTLCLNGLGPNYAGESGGTFGSGTTLNRNTGPSTLVPDYLYVSNVSGIGNVNINDGSYGIINNISPFAATNRNARRVPNCNAPLPIPAADSCKFRMFNGNWEIEGDHTGATTKYGNNPPANGSRGGYMLVVNADYVTSDAYEQTINNLCPNTFYQFSAWFRNICRTCGADNNLTVTNNPGVRPSLTLSIDGIDRYNTGEIDTTGWIKKAFLFKTGSSQNSVVFAIRNNSQGGGGNDWALDDIEINTCGPVTKMNFTPLLRGCDNGVQVNLSDTVRYRYNNTYSWFKWQRSTNGGLNWSDPPVPHTGQIVPTLINGQYTFVTNYPSFMAYKADSGHLYRVLVATTEANLNSVGCSYTDGNNVFLDIIPCNSVLEVSLTDFWAKISQDGKPVLQWTTSQESGMLKYIVEKSTDGINFHYLGNLNAKNQPGGSVYQFLEQEVLQQNAWYRLKMIGTDGNMRFSKMAMLSAAARFNVVSVVNPFSDAVNANISLPTDGVLNMVLYDFNGKIVGRESRRMQKGTANVLYTDVARLMAGVYVMAFEFDGQLVQRKLTKLN
jgi:hypothetical protein